MKKWFVALFLLFAIAIGVAFFAKERIIESAIQKWAAANAIPLKIRINSLGWRSVSISDFELQDLFRVKFFELTVHDSWLFFHGIESLNSKIDFVDLEGLLATFGSSGGDGSAESSSESLNETHRGLESICMMINGPIEIGVDQIRSNGVLLAENSQITAGPSKDPSDGRISLDLGVGSGKVRGASVRANGKALFDCNKRSWRIEKGNIEGAQLKFGSLNIDRVHATIRSANEVDFKSGRLELDFNLEGKWDGKNVGASINRSKLDYEFAEKDTRFSFDIADPSLKFIENYYLTRLSGKLLGHSKWDVDGEFSVQSAAIRKNASSIQKLFKDIKLSSGDIKGKFKLSDLMGPSAWELSLNTKSLALSFGEVEILGVDFPFQASGRLNEISYAHGMFDVQEIQASVPIQNLNGTLETSDGNLILVDFVTANVDGADVKLSPFQVNIQDRTMTESFVMVKKLKLQRLLEFAYNEKEARSKGEISGTVKFATEDHSLVLREGQFKSPQKGWIKIRPHGSSPPNKSEIPANPKRILDNYLYDFDYKELELDVHSDTKYQTYLTLKALGQNKDYLDGKPLKLALNLEFNLEKLIRSYVLSMGLSERLRDKLLELGNK